MWQARLLLPPHVPVNTAPADKIDVASRLDKTPLPKHQDQVRRYNRRQPVRDNQGGSVLRNRLQRILNFAFGSRIKRGRRLVQDQNGRVFEQRARDRNSLFSPSLRAAATTSSVVAPGLA